MIILRPQVTRRDGIRQGHSLLSSSRRPVVATPGNLVTASDRRFCLVPTFRRAPAGLAEDCVEATVVIDPHVAAPGTRAAVHACGGWHQLHVGMGRYKPAASDRTPIVAQTTERNKLRRSPTDNPRSKVLSRILVHDIGFARRAKAWP